MPNHSPSLGLMALVAAAVVLPAQAQADHENRYFGFGYQPNPYFYNPPPVTYPPPPRMRQRAPGIYEYEVAPGHWVRVRPGHAYEPPRQRERRTRTRRQPQQPQETRRSPAQQPQQTRRSPGPPPLPKIKPEVADEPDIAVQSPPSSTAPERVPERARDQSPERAPQQQPAARQAAAPDAGEAISCEAAADIVKSFGFSDVQSTSCSGATYGFEAARDGSAYTINLSAADGELTEVRKH